MRYLEEVETELAALQHQEDLDGLSQEELEPIIFQALDDVEIHEPSAASMIVTCLTNSGLLSLAALSSLTTFLGDVGSATWFVAGPGMVLASIAGAGVLGHRALTDNKKFNEIESVQFLQYLIATRNSDYELARSRWEEQRERAKEASREANAQPTRRELKRRARQRTREIKNRAIAVRKSQEKDLLARDFEIGAKKYLSNSLNEASLKLEPIKD